MTAFDEGVRTGMEKVAASVDELQAAYNRAGIIRMTRGGARAGGHDGPFTFFDPKKTKQELLRLSDVWKDFPMHSKALKKDAIKASKSGEPSQAFMTRHGTGNNGYSARTPEGWRASNIRSGLHEVGERRVKPEQYIEDYRKQFHHGSPKVIFDEHNLVKKMTGPGSDEARRIHLRMRAGGELKDIKAIVNKHYGARGWDYIKQHGFSKAMKKDLIRQFKLRSKGAPLRMMAEFGL